MTILSFVSSLRRSDKSYWMTTGLYPQEFIVTFREPIEFRQISFVTTNGTSSRSERTIKSCRSFLVKRFVMSVTSNNEPRNFETILEKSLFELSISPRSNQQSSNFFSALSNNENGLQATEHTLDRATEARHFKCVILAGYDSFASVHSLRFDAGKGRTGRK